MISSLSVMANFHPQVWLNDNNLMDVPPPQNVLSEWDCTDHLFNNQDLFAEVMKFFLSTPEDLFSDITDYIAADPAAPEWVRNWKKNFPFETYLRLGITIG